MSLTAAEIVELIEKRSEDIAERAAEKAINQLFTALGVDISDPLSMQKDFAYIRAMRENMDLIKKRSIIAIISIVVPAMLAALYTAFHNKF